MYKKDKAKLVLADGRVFLAKSFGFNKSVSGELVFTTSMTGYPESLTDPSYRGQILSFSYPLIGNYGIPKNTYKYDLPSNFESENIHTSAVIVSDYSENFCHYNSEKSLSAWLIENKVPALTDIDTRALTKSLRERGSTLGKIIIDDEVIDFYNPNLVNLVDSVSIKQKTLYKVSENAPIIILIDCGVKFNIIRSLLKRNLNVLRVPWNYDFTKEKFDGILISNGPGDPKSCKKTIENIKIMLKKDKPIFGICLGNQILALAAGGDTYKLKYGHRSHNQPCLDTTTDKCFITSQNHGYAVDSIKLSENFLPYFINVNDGTNEGIRHKTKPFMSVQFHPEATSGPTDTGFLFDVFKAEIEKRL